jgi:hypothetical protein
MKRLKLAVGITTIILGVAGIGYGVYVAAHFYLGEEPHQPDIHAVCGDKKGVNHTLVIKHDTITPKEVNAQRCDTLTIINQDDKQRRLAFGEHTHHQSYDGVDGKLVGQNEQIMLTLTESGKFMIHDHFQDSVHAYFTVAE